MNASGNAQGQQMKPPTALGNFLQPGFPFAKIFTALFFHDRVVFAKSGSGATNAAGTMQASLGGFTPTALVAGAVGSIVDSVTSDKRAERAAGLAALDPEAIVASHKKNFMLPYGAVKSVEIKGPNFAGEVKVIIVADKTHKFRIDKQSKAAAKYIEEVFAEFFPGKITRK